MTSTPRTDGPRGDAVDLDEIEREMSAQLEGMRESGLAAPFPTELRAREFKD